jgi:GntR family transcriptional repressor for pyruvate dehydrogenase complex
MSDKYEDGGVTPAELSHVRIAELLKREGIRPGELLPSESELGARLGTGRQQIREGLRVLEAFGAITGRQGARRIWRGFDLGTLLAAGSSLPLGEDRLAWELLEVRHALETALLPSVAVRLRADDLAELRALAGRMIALADAGHSFSEVDALFHRRLFARLGNSVLDAILLSFWSQFDAVRPNQGLAAEDPDVARMHARIVDALAAGDQRLAVHELDAHFYGVRQLLAEASGDSTVGNDDIHPQEGTT